jgi:hypothetical protein
MRINEVIDQSDMGLEIGDMVAIEINDTLIETVIIDLLADGVVVSCDAVFESFLNRYAQLETLTEAQYQGRKVTLSKPFLTPDGPKKRSVYVKNAKGNVVKVNFGDKKLRIKKHNPKRRKSFRARHRCKTPGPKWKARYWSCRFW